MKRSIGKKDNIKSDYKIKILLNTSINTHIKY